VSNAYIWANGRQVGEVYELKRNIMITKEEIVELLNDYSGYVDRSCTDKAIHEDNFELIADAILSKLHQPTVSRQSELLFAFIKAIKEEFKDENWDYLDFIADRVIGKQ